MSVRASWKILVEFKAFIKNYSLMVDVRVSGRASWRDIVRIQSIYLKLPFDCRCQSECQG